MGSRPRRVPAKPIQCYSRNSWHIYLPPDIHVLPECTNESQSQSVLCSLYPDQLGRYDSLEMTHSSALLVPRKLALTYLNPEQVWRKLLIINVFMAPFSIFTCIYWFINQTYAHLETFQVINKYMEPIQIILWGIIEFCLSGAFIAQMWKFKWTDVERKAIYVLILVAICDCSTTLANVFFGDLESTCVKGCVYSLRIRLEISVLNQMVEFVKAKRGAVSYGANNSSNRQGSHETRWFTPGNSRVCMNSCCAESDGCEKCEGLDTRSTHTLPFSASVMEDANRHTSWLSRASFRMIGRFSFMSGSTASPKRRSVPLRLAAPMEDYSAERDSYALELADHTLSTSVNQEFNKPCSGFSSTFHAVSDEEQPGPQSSCNEPQENEQSDEPAVLLMKAADENDVEAVVTSAVFELAAHAKTHSRSGSVGMLDIGRRRWDSEADESDLPVDPFNYFCRKSSRNSEDEDGRQYLRRKSSYKGEIDDSNKHFVRRKRNRRDKEETTNEHDEGEPLELSAQCICVVSLDDYLFQGEKVHTFPAVHSLTAVSYI